MLFRIIGMKVIYDMCYPDGSRVLDVTVVCSNCTIPHYVEVNDDATYNVLTTTHLTSGGDGYSVLQDNVLQTWDIGQ